MINMSCATTVLRIQYLLAVLFVFLCHPYAIKFCWFYELSLVTVCAVEVIKTSPKMASAPDCHQGAAKSLKIPTRCLKEKSLLTKNYFIGERAQIRQSIVKY